MRLEARSYSQWLMAQAGVLVVENWSCQQSTTLLPYQPQNGQLLTVRSCHQLFAAELPVRLFTSKYTHCMSNILDFTPWFLLTSLHWHMRISFLLLHSTFSKQESEQEQDAKVIIAPTCEISHRALKLTIANCLFASLACSSVSVSAGVL